MTLQTPVGSTPLGHNSFATGNPPTETPRGNPRGACISGYVPGNETTHRIINFALGLVFVVMTFHFFLLISLALLLTQGPRIFYSGDRYGRDRRVFKIYKFRTLDYKKALSITKSQVLPPNSGIETPLGKYLRSSRLDELPQLFNILKGDMNIIGPRPVRPALARLQEKENPHYSVRYRVRPGLIGHTQAYMGHGTSKRLRSKLNYMFCTCKVSYAADLLLMVRVGYEVILTSIRLIIEKAAPNALERRAHRLAQAHQMELVSETGQHQRVSATYGDMVRLRGTSENERQTLVLRTRSGGLRRVRVSLMPTGEPDVFLISPANEHAQHLVSRYLRNDPVIPPRRPKMMLTSATSVPPNRQREPLHTDSGAESDRSVAKAT